MPTSRIPNDDDPLLGISDIAHLLGCGQEHARNLVKAHTFGPPVDISPHSKYRRWKVRRSAVEAWEQQSRKATTP